MGNLLDSLSVRQKLIMLSGFFAIILISMVVYTVLTLQQQTADSTVINVAGRQRMLSQKFTKELLDEVSHPEISANGRGSDKTRKLFEVSLSALRMGGTTYSDLGMTKPVTLPGNTDQAVENKLVEVEAFWKMLQDAADKLRETKPGTDEYEHHLVQVRDLNVKTLANMHQAVGMLAKLSSGKISTMMTAEWVILVIALLLGGWISFLVGRAIVDPLAKVVGATKQIAGGDLHVNEAALAITAKDEVGELARSFSTMIGVLRSLESELKQATDQARDGNLNHRCDNSQFTGDWAGLLQGMNDIIDAFTGPITETSNYLDRISRGDIPQPISREYRGDFNKIKNSLNRCVDAVNGLLDESNQLIRAAQCGQLDARGNSAPFDGSWGELIDGINNIFDAVAEPVRGTRHILQVMADGSLTNTLDGDFQGEFAELQENVNSTIQRLRETIGPIQEAADLISTSASEIASGNTNLSSRTEQQASALEETASSMEQLTSTVKNNAGNAQQANQLAASARQTAEQGGEVIGNAVHAMEAINSASTRIAEIIGVIDEIAFQTNLLALNASVEAARAGEQGRGFAVVATEVRNLAGRSATAAKEIKGLIQDSVEKVQVGAELVNESGQTLDEIVNGVKKVGDIISEIAAASQEQSAGIDQINHAVTSMDEMTQQNAALAEETSAASASMSDKAVEMDRLMSFFTVGNSPSASRTAKKPVPHPRQTAQSPVVNSVSTVPASQLAESVEPSDDASDEWEEF